MVEFQGGIPFGGGGFIRGVFLGGDWPFMKLAIRINLRAAANPLELWDINQTKKICITPTSPPINPHSFSANFWNPGTSNN